MTRHIISGLRYSQPHMISRGVKRFEATTRFLVQSDIICFVLLLPAGVGIIKIELWYVWLLSQSRRDVGVRFLRLVGPFFLLSSLLVLAACGSGSPSNNVTSSGAPLKPTATSTPSVPHLGESADQIVNGLKGKGLPIGDVFTYTATNDPNNLLGRPGQYTSKDNFKDTRISSTDTGADITVSDGGAVEVFANATDAQKRFAYLQSISTSGNAMFAEYEYLDGVAILRVSSQLTPDQAKAYQAAFTSLK